MKQRGIALIQVLLLSTILAIALLSMQHQARQHIKLASAVKQYTIANMQLHSAEAEILFTLLSQQPFQLTNNNNNSVKWNFHGQPFTFNNVQINIQDTSGLLSASNPKASILKALTEQQVGSATLGQQIAAALADWQDKDDITRLDGAEQADYADIQVRNAPLQYIEEWLFVKGVDNALFSEIRPLLTLFPQGVNVNQQPEELWRLYMPDTKVKELSRARDNGQLTAELFEIISGIVIDEFTTFGTGPGYRISFTVTNNDVKLSRQLTLRVMPFNSQPFDIYEYRMRNLPADTLNAVPIN